ncbi:MAG TPA: SIMPL domain-containing protein [Gaiellaceae bacterium]|jgi:hypothetical protein
MKLVVVSVLAAAALASAGCGGENAKRGEAGSIALAGSVGASSAAVSAPVQTVGGVQDGITVVGTGTADVVPDIADWSFGVQSDAATSSAALAANASAMEKVIAALRKAGVARDDIRTDEVSLYPQTSNDGRTVTGYSASNAVTATIRDLGAAGRVVDAAVGAGANNVYGPDLRPSDTDSAYREAVNEAFDDARAHAEAIAAKAGVSLGAPVSITEGGGYAPGPVYYDRATPMSASAGAAAEVAPVEPGKQQVSASLTVTFSIATGA